MFANVSAQKKIGVFIHGFQGGPEKWTVDSRVPTAWTTGDQAILDDKVVLSYETMDIKSQASLDHLVGKFIKDMKEKGDPAKDEWILIGHSLGGLVAREIYPSLKINEFNIVAVISIGGPSQGTMATDVDTSYINSRLKLMQDRIEDAYETRIISLDVAVQILDIVEGKDNLSKIAKIPFYIESVRDSALGYSEEIIEHNANSLIGPEGEVIERINSYNYNNIKVHPPNYLSLIGAEKNKAPIRMAGHIFEGDAILKDEGKMLKQLDDLRNKYFQRNQDLHNVNFDINYTNNLLCRASLRWFDLWNKCQHHEDAFKKSRENRELWRTAKKEIDQIGNIWAEFINAYRYETVYYRIYVPPCEEQSFSDQLAIKLPDENCSDNPNGEYVYKSSQVKVPVKHDGVVTTHSVLWSKTDNFNDLNNIYMKDVNITPRGDDGGYNHFELRNYERAYTLKENGQVVFSEGNPNPAMEEAEDWLKGLFGIQ